MYQWKYASMYVKQMESAFMQVMIDLWWVMVLQIINWLQLVLIVVVVLAMVCPQIKEDSFHTVVKQVDGGLKAVVQVHQISMASMVQVGTRGHLGRQPQTMVNTSKPLTF